MGTKITPLLHSGAWKSYRIAPYNFTTINWEDIYFDIKISDECFGDISYFDEGLATKNTSIIVIKGFTDLFRVGGCLHTLWGGAVGTSVKFAARIVTSLNQGMTWTESRCLQTLDFESRGTDSEGTTPINGTIRTYGEEMWVKLQARTSNISMSLQGDAWFDHPIAATLHLTASHVRY